MKRLLIAILTVFCIANPTWADGPYKVTGTVVEKNSEDESSKEVPLAGAHIVLDTNQEIGTYTDTDGNFTLEIPAAGYITISMVGYKTQTIYIKETTELDKIELEQDSSLIEESIRTDCKTEKLKKLNAKNGIVLKERCQPTKCDEPRYKLEHAEGYTVKPETIGDIMQ